jgi:cbb3-type cytochrome oxidase subunit 1
MDEPALPKPLGAYVPFVRTGNLLYLSGMLLMVWNVAKTATRGRYQPVRIPLVAAHAQAT